jgi:Lon protease-like protein
VLFPGGRLPLRIFEQRYLAMAKTCLKDDAPFGVCLIHHGKEVGEPAVPVGVGCLARIAEWDMPQLGVLQVTARGESRFRILGHRVQGDGLVRASIELLPEGGDAPVPEAAARYVKLLERVIQQHPALLERPHRLDSSAWVSARLAELLPLPLATKQALLEIDDPRARLARLQSVLAAPS